MSLITDLSQSAEIKSATKLAEMGTNARGMVSTHTACVAFLESFSPGCTAERGAAMPAYTLHEDGTVTLD